MTFDPIAYKAATRGQWQAAAEAWHRWGPTLGRWLGPATELMLDTAGIRGGSRVLDVAAGTGEQTLVAARRVGPAGFVLATDIAPNLLALAAEDARQAGLTHVETREMGGTSWGRNQVALYTGQPKATIRPSSLGKESALRRPPQRPWTPMQRSGGFKPTLSAVTSL